MEPSIFEQFQNDSRVIDAKNILLDVYSEYQQKLTKKRPLHGSSTTPNTSTDLDANNCLSKEMISLELRKGGGSILPYLGSGMGSGSLVEMSDGRVVYDFISGIGAHFSHGDSKVVKANLDASFQDVVNQGNLQQNNGVVSLMELLCETSGFDHCFLTTSGAMAAENALKIMFQKKFPAHRILAFEGCFMGRTYLMSQITDKPGFREGIPTQVSVDYIPFYDENNAVESTRRAVDALKTYLTRYPNQYAVMCMVLIQGEAGYYSGSREFFEVIMSELKAHNVGILVDEIQTFGRTGSFYAFQEFGLEKFVDVVTVGKLSQTCATLFNKDFSPKPGLLSQTFTSSTSVIESSKVILKEMRDGDYFGPDGKNMKIRECFVRHLKRLSTMFPEKVEGPFGFGTMIAFTSFGGDKDKTIAFVKHLFNKGVLCFVAGRKVARIRFLVPIGSVTEHDIDNVFLILEQELSVFEGLLIQK
ncbi:aminotransferase class III-fold pyridoxal phosphate-dependent enzyme [bacterium]|nr:aminotransferase class III-fold pyridoxal phosphate-dependent enzyme [bacterium]